MSSMSYEDEVDYLVREITQHGRRMQQMGYALAHERIQGIEDRETSTHSMATAYWNDRQMLQDQEEQRVRYAIDRLVAIKLNRASQ